MANIVMVVLIIVGLFLLLTPAPPPNHQVACYARLLGIPKPIVKKHVYRIGDLQGQATQIYTGEVVIDLYRGHDHLTVAHEVRHAWQFASGWEYEQGVPYHNQQAEIDARRWAKNNWNKC